MKWEGEPAVLIPAGTRAPDVIGPTVENALYSIAISLKRIADAFDNSETGGKPQGSVLWWLEIIASAANAGRS